MCDSVSFFFCNTNGCEKKSFVWCGPVIHTYKYRKSNNLQPAQSRKVHCRYFPSSLVNTKREKLVYPVAKGFYVVFFCVFFLRVAVIQRVLIELSIDAPVFTF